MKTNFQFVSLDVSAGLKAFTQEKLDKLGKKYEDILRADVFFKEEPGSAGKGKICEIRLSVPGPRLFASSDEESFEAAAAETVRDLERQLRKRKD